MTVGIAFIGGSGFMALWSFSADRGLLLALKFAQIFEFSIHAIDIHSFSYKYNFQ